MPSKFANRISGEPYKAAAGGAVSLYADRGLLCSAAERHYVPFQSQGVIAEGIVWDKKSFEEARLQLRISPLEDALAAVQHELSIALEHIQILEARLSRVEAENVLALSVKPIDRRDAQEQADPRLADVLEATQEMFGERPSIALMRDPEVPECPFVVVTVKAKGKTRELIERRLEWHDRISKISPGNSGAFRLSIIPE